MSPYPPTPPVYRFSFTFQSGFTTTTGDGVKVVPTWTTQSYSETSDEDIETVAIKIFRKNVLPKMEYGPADARVRCIALNLETLDRTILSMGVSAIFENSYTVDTNP